MAKTPSKKAPAKATKAVAGGKKRSKKRTESYSTYIYKVLKQVHPDTGISKKGMGIMNSFISHVFKHNVIKVEKLTTYNKKGHPLVPQDPDYSQPHAPQRAHQARHVGRMGTTAVTKFFFT